MDFDSILPDVGSFGIYQKLVIAVLLPAVLPCAFHAYSQLFIASRPAHWCRIPELDPWVNKYPELIRNLSIPYEYRDGDWKYEQCRMYLKNYTDIANRLRTKNNSEVLLSDSYDNNLSTNNYGIVPCESGWNYDREMFPNTVVMEWDLVCDRDLYTTFALILFGVGGLIGNYIFGYLQDYWGRTPSFFFYLFIEIIACILSSFAWNYISWLIFRVVVGFTVPAILASPYVLAIELVGPYHRVFCTIILNIGYSLGLVLLACIVYLVRDWRCLTLAVSLPLLLLFTCFFVLPESPRWLLAIGNYRRAAKIMKTMARFNGKTISDNYEEILRQIGQRERDKNSEYVARENRQYGLLDLFRTPNMRSKTLIITFIWFSNTCVYVGLSYYAPLLGGDEIWNFFLAGAVELPTYIFLWPGLMFFGRRWILCASMIIGGLACLGTFLVQQNQNIMLALYCVGKMGISSAFVVLPLAASELYPTVVRGLGMSFSSVIGMIGPIVIPIINHMGNDMLVLPIIIMGTLLTLGGVASLFLPETMGKSLPQTIEDGENVSLNIPFSHSGTKKRIDNHIMCSMCKIEIKTIN